MPIAVIAITIIHLTFLHEKGSSNPKCSQTNIDKMTFHPFFSTKDLLPITITATTIILLIRKNPNYLGDPENFNPANPISTPIHIQPE
jgi:ubiquinol-cytochrome c reductase cytochrome b subunit